MERLTEKHYMAEGYYLKCSEGCDVDMDCVDCPVFEKVVDRLGAYEDGGWISVKDKLPEIMTPVLVVNRYAEYEGVTIGYLFRQDRRYKPFWMFYGYWMGDDMMHHAMGDPMICPGSEYITHWMPLPEPPDTRKPYEPPKAEIIMKEDAHE